jgi:hypothetical protein
MIGTKEINYLKLYNLMNQVYQNPATLDLRSFFNDMKTEKVKSKSRLNTDIDFTNSVLTQSVVNLSYRLEKFRIRKWIVETASDLREIYCLTLPGTEWLMERDLLLKYGPRVKLITALEKDAGVYEYSRNNLPVAGNIEFLLQSVEEFFSSRAKHSYNLIWLDYMGPFSFNRVETFKTALQNGYLKSRSVVCFTFLNGREHSEVLKFYSKFGGENYTAQRLKAIPKAFEEVGAKYGFTAQVLKTESYCEHHKGCTKAPMVFIAMKFEKASLRG